MIFGLERILHFEYRGEKQKKKKEKEREKALSW